MKPHFSEFTYGFALTNEIVSRIKSTIGTAPIFPSLIDEGKEGGGYDVSIEFKGKPVFYQFKLSHYMKRKHASERHLFNGPYYRFELMALRHSDQHNLLLDLEAVGNTVFYCAPKFYEASQLNSFFTSSSIASNSIFIRPSKIGNLPDDDYHSVCFEIGNPNIYLCSEPVPIEDVNFNDAIEQITINGEVIDLTYLKNLEDKLIEIAQKKLKTNSDSNIYNKMIADLTSPIKRIALLSRTIFNCDFMIVGKEIKKNSLEINNENSNFNNKNQ